MLSRYNNGARRPNGCGGAEALIFDARIILESGMGVEGREDNGRAENEDCFRECDLAKAEASWEPDDPDDEDRGGFGPEEEEED